LFQAQRALSVFRCWNDEWTFRTLGKNLTETVVTRKEHTLVTTGPYRWIRHPFCVAAALAFLGNSLAAANWFLFVTGGVAVLLLVIRSRKEEENLIARFGDDYRNYMQRTGRFVPHV
jgi:protein-S-isoprenylcysteine O-methyltransferase Ste14